MKEISVSNSYLINEKVYDLDIKFYQVSSIAEPVEVFDTVSITHLSTGFSGLVIEIKTKDFVYPNYFYNLNIKLYEDILTDSISLSLYQLSSVEFPTLLPTPLQTINQSIESTTSYEYRDLSIGTYLTSPNTTYYFLLYKEPISEIVRYSLRLNLTENTNKRGKINVTSKYDSPLPQYLKYDNNDFENTNIRLNLYNGKYILSKPLLTLPGKSLSTNIILTYNSYRNDPNYIDLKDITYLRLRNNWNLNYIMQLKKHITEDKFLYIDGYGEHYYFTKVADNTYVNTEGRGMYLIKNFVTYELYDKDNNRILFNSEGYAMSIKNQLYTLDMIYAEIGNQVFLDSIKDSSARVTSITYESSRIIITKPDNKEIIITYGNSGVTSVVDEYGQTTTYTYNTNKNVAKITKGIYSLDIIQTEDEVTKLLYNTNNTIKYTKEYQYSESSSDDITTITMYKNTKNDNNQIIRKYYFNSKGDYIRDYEDIGDSKKYDENKRQEDLYNIELDEDTTILYKSIYHGSDKLYALATEEQITNDNLYLEKEATHLVDMSPDCNTYKLIYILEYPNVGVTDDIKEECNIKVTISNETSETKNILHYLHLRLIKNQMPIPLAITDEEKEQQNLTNLLPYEIGYEYKDSNHKIYIVINLNQVSSLDSLNLKYNVTSKYLMEFCISESYILADATKIPTAFVLAELEGTVMLDNMPFNIGQMSRHKTDGIVNTRGYGLIKPTKIIYINSTSEEVELTNVDMTLNELIINGKNYANGKKVMWYNNFKNVILDDNLYTDLYSQKLVYGEKVMYFGGLIFTIPIIDENNKTKYYLYNFNNAYEQSDEFVVEEDDSNSSYIVINSVTKDIYGKVLEEEYTNRVPYTGAFPEDFGLINRLTKYSYDENNNLIKEEVISKDIYEEGLVNEAVILKREYLYDLTGNFLEKVIETKINDNVEVKNTYNTLNGSLLSTTSVLDATKNYLYDDNDYLIKITQTSANSTLSNHITYENDMIKSYLYNNSQLGYSYTYDDNKILTNVSKLNNSVSQVIESYEIVEEIDEDNQLGLMNGWTAIIITYVSGEKIAYIYDKYNRLVTMKNFENNGYQTIIEYIYAEKELNITEEETEQTTTVYDVTSLIDERLVISCESLLRSVFDYVEGIKTEYYYDEDDRLISTIKKGFVISQETNQIVVNSDNMYNNQITYENNRIVSSTINGTTYSYTYERANKLKEVYINLGNSKSITIENEYDNTGTITRQNYNYSGATSSSYEEYEYRTISTTEVDYSSLPLQYKKQFSNELYAITYDKENKITKITNKATSTDILEYTYDGFGNLTEETNRLLNKRFTYTYNEIGNIIQKETYDLNNQMIGLLIYTYDSTNSDELINVYDPAGININISYTNRYPNQINNNTLIWEKGTNLKQYKNDTNTYTYYYNANNIRYKKALTGTNNITIEYNLSGSTILEETRKQDNIVLSTIKYIYSGQSILGFIYTIDNESTYYAYEKDILNNIVALYKIGTTTELVATYIYDAWGNHTVYDATGVENTDPTFIGNINPFRYKGYYYDVETSLFWLSSRYYSPELCRFISPDDVEYLDPESVNGLNLYCYCANDPINHVDPSGHAWYHWAIGAGIIVACAALTVITAGGFAAAGAAFASVVTTTMAPTALSAVFAGATIGAAAIGAAGAVIGGKIDENGFSWDNDWSWENSSKGFMIGSIAGAVVGGAWGGTHYALQSAGKMAVRVNTSSLKFRPDNPLSDDGISYWTKTLSQNNFKGYNSLPNQFGDITHIDVFKGTNFISNGHHRVHVLLKYGVKYINVFYV